MKVSALNLVPRFEDEEVIDAIERAVRLAQLVESLGYNRYWVAEHHNFKGTASSASDVIVQYILERTKTIKIGAGGVMMPNHIPLQIAERYGTLESLYPNRIDIGLGRAPETDYQTAQILYQDNDASALGFLKSVEIIRNLLGSSEEGETIAFPGENTNIPLYILGSSTSSAYVAAKLGLPYAFATYFSPSLAKEAISIYRENFVPSEQLKEPYLILSLIATLANTVEEAEKLHKTNQAAFINLVEGINSESIDAVTSQSFEDLSSAEKIIMKTLTGLKLVGTVESVQNEWQKIKDNYQPDEIMAVSYLSQINELETSYRLLKELAQS